MGTHILSISAMEYIIKNNEYIIVNDDISTKIYHKDNIHPQVEYFHNKAKEHLMNEDKYISYNLYLRRYNKYKDKEDELSKRIIKECLTNLDRMVYIYSIKQLFTELLKKQLIPVTYL